MSEQISGLHFCVLEAPGQAEIPVISCPASKMEDRTTRDGCHLGRCRCTLFDDCDLGPGFPLHCTVRSHVCMYVCMYVYTYMHIYTHINMHIHICMCIYNIHMYMCVFMISLFSSLSGHPALAVLGSEKHVQYNQYTLILP